ncbi:MAG: hypothetical protein JRI25_05805 [Deltaproteobacteria bacterium]|nr:hypothetical protein [Deltaproteobacteria bacterium]
MSDRPSRKRFPSSDALDAAYEFARQRARADGYVDPVAIGGYALQLYGSPRLTLDLDVIVEGEPSLVVPLGELSFGGIRVEAPNGVPVDFIVRNDAYRDLYREAAQHAAEVEDVRAVQPHYLVALKLASAVHRGRQRRDLDDIAFLVKTDQVDLTRARDIIERHLGPYAAQRFDELVREIQLLESEE